MSNDLAIKVENISKRYVVGELVSAGDLKRWATAPLRWAGLRRTGSNGHGDPDAPAGISQRRIGRHEFWALKDVSFEVRKGEVLGIIGHNGAGKSTLLKILSRITAPTTGRIDLYGRVASLLEVGTGFHPELTGRENVYLNGSILGMSKREIDRKFDEIVDFAGVEEFIDTPVKRYSSGMTVRLGFAVAAHLEPEILIVDEVLAVGDFKFQQRCIGRMDEVARSGRTVLFVSHNLPVVQQLCSRGILLKGGELLKDGGTTEVLDLYQSTGGSTSLALGKRVDLRSAERWGGSGAARLTSVTPFDPRGGRDASFRQGDLGFDLELTGDIRSVAAAGVQICDMFGRKIVNANTLEHCQALGLDHGDTVRIVLRRLRLRPGLYKVGFWIGGSETDHIDVVADHCVLQVLPPLDKQWISEHEGLVEIDFTSSVISSAGVEVQ